MTHRSRPRALLVAVRPLRRPALWGATAVVLVASGAGSASSGPLDLRAGASAASAAGPGPAVAAVGARTPSRATEQLLADRGAGGVSRSEARRPLAAPSGDAQDAAAATRAEQQAQREAEQQAAREAEQQAAQQAEADAAAQAQREAQAAQAAHDAEVAAAVADPRSVARAMLAAHGWGEDQFACLDSLWTKESGWKHTADNSSSSAYGIPQSLPGAKMASAGADWQTNPRTQITWGLDYIASSYGTPCGAWAHSRASNWY